MSYQEVITNGGTSVTESFGACEESHTQRVTVPGSPSVDEAEWLGRCSGCLYDIAVLQYRQHAYRCSRLAYDFWFYLLL